MTLKSDEFGKNDARILAYSNGIQLLRNSAIEAVLREKGQPSMSGIQNETQALAVEAARSFGYNQALDDIFYYKEKYILEQTTPVGKTISAPDFGAINKMLERGDITKEEADGLKRQ